jgi:hypothetical protein
MLHICAANNLRSLFVAVLKISSDLASVVHALGEVDAMPIQSSTSPFLEFLELTLFSIELARTVLLSIFNSWTLSRIYLLLGLFCEGAIHSNWIKSVVHPLAELIHVVAAVWTITVVPSRLVRVI